MFSRLARPINTHGARLIPALPSCGKVLNLGSVRFESIRTRADNYEHFDKVAEEMNQAALKRRDEGVVGQFGWLPFYGMLGTILISKELVVLQTEFMLATAFGAWAFVAYITLGESVNNYLTGILADNKTRYDHIAAWHLAKLRVYKAKTQIEAETGSVLEEMLSSQRKVEAEYLNATNLEQRHALRQAVLDKLNQIKVREDAAAALERTQLINSAVANVYSTFEEDDGPLREEALELAISLLGTDGSTSLEDDPVKKLFVKQFE